MSNPQTKEQTTLMENVKQAIETEQWGERYTLFHKILQDTPTWQVSIS